MVRVQFHECVSGKIEINSSLLASSSIVNNAVKKHFSIIVSPHNPRRKNAQHLQTRENRWVLIIDTEKHAEVNFKLL